MKAKRALAATGMAGLLTIGCGGSDPAAADGADGDGPIGTAALAISAAAAGRELYDEGTFGGNGRTCSTCHGALTGTFSPAEATLRFALDPHDPLFRPIDSDGGAGVSYSRLLGFATIRVTLALPANVTLADAPGATTVTVERGVPSTMDAPALDPVIMWDGREPTLTAQASAAILGHAQATVTPTALQLSQIAAFEQGELFSSDALRRFAEGHPAPALPAGVTPSEQRGRAFFDPSSANGLCARCHSGPMLDQTDAFAFGLPPGARFASAHVSEMNARGLAVHGFVFAGAGGTTTVSSPDVGRALVTGDAADANLFKIPSLWGVKRTAPYFHDSSAATLADVAAHYAAFFAAVTHGATTLSAQDQADIVAYLELL